MHACAQATVPVAAAAVAYPGYDAYGQPQATQTGAPQAISESQGFIFRLGGSIFDIIALPNHSPVLRYSEKVCAGRKHGFMQRLKG